MLPNCVDYFRNAPAASFPLTTSSTKPLSSQVESSLHFPYMQTSLKSKHNNELDLHVNNNSNNISVASNNLSPPNAPNIPNANIEPPNPFFGGQYIYGLDSANPQYNQFATLNTPQVDNEEGYFNFSKYSSC